MALLDRAVISALRPLACLKNRMQFTPKAGLVDSDISSFKVLIESLSSSIIRNRGWQFSGSSTTPQLRSGDITGVMHGLLGAIFIDDETTGERTGGSSVPLLAESNLRCEGADGGGLPTTIGAPLHFIRRRNNATRLEGFGVGGWPQLAAGAADERLLDPCAFEGLVVEHLASGIHFRAVRGGPVVCLLAIKIPAVPLGPGHL
eukprot:SAG31_NODE_52_length_30366_cov_34.368586_8_plen_203_part_00